MQVPIVMTVFTDPMMGLSYESEPILDALSAQYGKRLQIRYVMSVLVRDVSDFMTPNGRADAALEQDLAFTRRMGVRALPSYLIQRGEHAVLMQSFHAEEFAAVINRLAREASSC